MITDPTKAEVNLFNALTKLNKAYLDDGSCIESGLQPFLRHHKVGAYSPRIAKELNIDKAIGYSPKGTHKSPLIYWNKSEAPTLDYCRKIFEGVKSRNRIKEALQKEKKKSLPKIEVKREIETPFDEGFFKKPTEPDDFKYGLTIMRDETLREIEKYEKKLTYYKNVYDYLRNEINKRN